VEASASEQTTDVSRCFMSVFLGVGGARGGIAGAD